MVQDQGLYYIMYIHYKIVYWEVSDAYGLHFE